MSDGRILKPEEYAARHKQAFRAAFDYLNDHFPPETDPEWWQRLAKDCSAVSIVCGENKLVIGLLIGVMDYLENEMKLRREKDGEADG